MLTINRLIRSKRRTLGLTVTKDAQLVVRAPLWMPESEIKRFINAKLDWIVRKQEFFRQRPQLSRRYADGEEFLFLGQVYRARIADDLPKAVVLDSELMISRQVLSNAADHVRIWYQNQAAAYIGERVRHYPRAHHLAYKHIRFNNAKTRWGSCGSSGTLNFTWRLIMAPPRVVDYVVVHELMHLKQMNHSRKFWKEVELIIPDYKQDEQWLKKNGHLTMM